MHAACCICTLCLMMPTSKSAPSCGFTQMAPFQHEHGSLLVSDSFLPHPCWGFGYLVQAPRGEVHMFLCGSAGFHTYTVLYVLISHMFVPIHSFHGSATNVNFSPHAQWLLRIPTIHSRPVHAGRWGHCSCWSRHTPKPHPDCWLLDYQYIQPLCLKKFVLIWSSPSWPIFFSILSGLKCSLPELLLSDIFFPPSFELCALAIGHLFLYDIQTFNIFYFFPLINPTLLSLLPI